MRNITRLIAASFVSAPLLIGAAGLASASAEDVYHEHEMSVATSEGAGSEGVYSGVVDGVAFFLEHESWADDEGAYSEETGSLADGHGWGGHGWGSDGAHYWNSTNYAGEEGAFSESVESHAGDNGWGEDADAEEAEVEGDDAEVEVEVEEEETVAGYDG
ncbi:hypothetical protein ACFFSW_28610 [Saccharothrix longispora]|uniref:Uncharacterized protein n=1 Tax=Saccharothrix longispora TaxID=33920 RepID=A0ABU1PT36_9PSEU|nr:hypothetical protein [Saccharothrix longispora]MDR6593274.1 hypothetical protein [Saccharothrix longispora]